ncbi:MAG TPA: ABC transporter permease, partial [Caldimonas sp.]|nr:ABC transporter permease [Caldimonas sp.]
IGDAMNKASLHIVKGRIYRTGMRELVVGRTLYDQYRGVDVGDQVLIHGAPWTVVGEYVDQGGIDEDSLAGDVDMVRTDLGSATYQSVGVMLASPGDFQAFSHALMNNPQLHVRVRRLSEYYRGQMGNLYALFDIVGFFVGGVMAVGAAAGALTTLYAAVDARRREIATLRAIGFDGAAVVLSIMAEALLLAVPGALIGLAVAGLGFGGHGVATANIVFQATMTPQVAAIGAATAIAIGLVGGAFPALRAARVEVAEALRVT